MIGDIYVTKNVKHLSYKIFIRFFSNEFVDFQFRDMYSSRSIMYLFMNQLSKSKPE